MQLTPTTKKTPANTAVGMRWSTISNGPVIVPMIASPMKKCDTRCSTTVTAVTIGLLISVSSPSSVRMIRRPVLYTVSESVCTGAFHYRLAIAE